MHDDALSRPSPPPERILSAFPSSTPSQVQIPQQKRAQVPKDMGFSLLYG